MHVDAGQVHVVGLQLAEFDDLLDLDDAELAGHRHRRVEVARRQVEAQVAAGVGDLRLDQRHVGHQRALHHVGVAIELAQLLALGDDGADTGLGEEGRDAGAAGAQLLGQRALRREFQFQLAGQVLALELLVLADVAADHLLDLARIEQLAEAETVDAGIVGDHRQVLRAGFAQGLDQRLRNAAQAEAAHRQHLAVLDDALQRLGGRGIDLVHEMSLLSCGKPVTDTDPERYYVSVYVVFRNGHPCPA